MFSSLPMVTISRDLRKQDRIDGQILLQLFADRLALSSGMDAAHRRQHIPCTQIYSPRTPLQSVRKLVVRGVLISRISQWSSCCDMNLLWPCPELECPSSADDSQK